MSSKTPDELAAAVLIEMGVIDPTETADDEDTDSVVDTYQNKWAELAAPAGDRELIYWPRDEIPIAVFLTVRDLIINEVAHGYGDPLDPQTKDANEVVILKRLRKHVAKAKTNTPALAEYF